MGRARALREKPIIMTTEPTDVLETRTAPRSVTRSLDHAQRWLRESPKFHLAVIGVLVAIVLAVVVWRAVSVGRLEDDLAATKANARTAMTAQAGELLQLTAIPLAWAIRADVLSGNSSNIDAYMDKLVREKYVKRIVFVDATGKVASSTNSKLKDQPAAVALAGIDLAATEPRVDGATGDLRIVVPVMSFERQVGTLVLDYSSTKSIDTKLGT